MKMIYGSLSVRRRFGFGEILEKPVPRRRQKAKMRPVAQRRPQVPDAMHAGNIRRAPR